MSTTDSRLTDFSGKFRPASLSDFKDYAKNLAWLTGLPKQKSQEILARIYGYSDLHELHAALKTLGKPGPFQDELAPSMDFREWVPARFAPQASRIDRLVREAVGKLPKHQHHRFELAPMLGLFTSPAQHRLCTALVKKQVRAIEHLLWSPSAVEMFVEYEFPWRVQKSAFECFRMAPRYAPNERAPDTHFLPQMQLDALCDHQLFWYPDTYDFQQAPSHRLAKAIRAYISAWLDEVDFVDATSFSPEFVDRMCSCWVEFLLDHSQKASKNPAGAQHIDWDKANTSEAIKELDQGWERRGALGKFLLTRDMSLVDGQSALMGLDDPDALAQVFALEYQRLHRKSYEDLYADLALATTVLYVSAPAPVGLGVESGAHLELMVQARTASKTETGVEQPLSFWTYSATLGLVNPQSRTFEPVALVKGLNVSPFRYGAQGKVVPASTEAFLEQMDAHSEQASQVAQTVVNELLPRLGWQDIEEFATSALEGGFLTFELEVLPEYRGKNVSALALNLLSRAFNQYPRSEWNADRLRRTPIPFRPAHGPFALGKPTFMVGVVSGEAVPKVRHIAAHLEQLSEAAGTKIVTVAVDLQHA
jgi:hypothetical protein